MTQPDDPPPFDPPRRPLSGGETAGWIALGVLAFFGVPIVGIATGGIGFLVGVAALAWAGVQAWRRGEPSRARVRRFCVGLGVGLVVFGGCFAFVMSDLSRTGFH